MDRMQLKEATAFLYEDASPSARKFCIDHNITAQPGCEVCHAPVKWAVNQKKFARFCSNRCRNEPRSIQVDSDWLRTQRIDKQRSIESIAAEMGVSSPTVEKLIIRHKIPQVRYNESNPMAMARLRDAEWLRIQHVDNRRTLDDIAEEIGSSNATVSRFLAQHGIEANLSNSYPREKVLISRPHQRMIDFIASLGVDFLVNDRSLLNGKEVDIWIPAHNLAIEVNGVYWHSEAAGKNSKYHLNKTEQCLSKGVRLLHIFTDTLESRPEIVFSMIRSLLGQVKTIGARELRVQEVQIQERRRFFTQNHLQGDAPASHAFGLFDGSELISLMSFGKSRWDKKYEWELVRFASVLNTRVVGGFSRLLAAFQASNAGSIISYSDRLWSLGGVYAKNGFVHCRRNPPGYQYLDPATGSRRHRSAFMKKRLAPQDPRPEWEILLERGYTRVWDCGTDVWTKSA